MSGRDGSAACEADAPGDDLARVSHVVFGWPYLEWGGVQRYFVAIARRLPRRVRVSVILPSGSDPHLVAELRGMGAQCVELPLALGTEPARSVAQRVSFRLRLWRVCLELWTQCARLAAAGTVFHLDAPPLLMSLPLARLARRHGVVVTIHTRLRHTVWWRRIAWRARLALLFRCRGFRLVAANADAHQGLQPYLALDRLRAIPVALPAFDADEIQAARLDAAGRAAVRSSLGVPPSSLLIVTGAQCIERKGVRVLARAAAEVRARVPDVDFLWISPAPPRAPIASLLREAGTLRVVTHEEIGGQRSTYLRAVACADLFVLPSLQEGLPLALLEAMACGVPVVSTAINGIPDAVADGESGRLVPPGDERALVAAIVELAGDPAKRRRFANAAKARVADFEVGTHARRTCAVYSDANSAALAGAAR